MGVATQSITVIFFSCRYRLTLRKQTASRSAVFLSPRYHNTLLPTKDNRTSDSASYNCDRTGRFLPRFIRRIRFLPCRMIYYLVVDEGQRAAGSSVPRMPHTPSNLNRASLFVGLNGGWFRFSPVPYEMTVKMVES